MGEMRFGHRVVVRKPEGRGSHKGTRLWLKGHIEVDLEEEVYGDMNWIHINQNSDQQKILKDTAMNRHVSYEEECG
jgi:hypothetical protein